MGWVGLGWVDGEHDGALHYDPGWIRIEYDDYDVMMIELHQVAIIITTMKNMMVAMRLV